MPPHSQLPDLPPPPCPAPSPIGGPPHLCITHTDQPYFPPTLLLSHELPLNHELPIYRTDPTPSHSWNFAGVWRVIDCRGVAEWWVVTLEEIPMAEEPGGVVLHQQEKVEVEYERHELEATPPRIQPKSRAATPLPLPPPPPPPKERTPSPLPPPPPPHNIAASLGYSTVKEASTADDVLAASMGESQYLPLEDRDDESDRWSVLSTGPVDRQWTVVFEEKEEVV